MNRCSFRNPHTNHQLPVNSFILCCYHVPEHITHAYGRPIRRVMRVRTRVSYTREAG